MLVEKQSLERDSVITMGPGPQDVDRQHRPRSHADSQWFWDKHHTFTPASRLKLSFTALGSFSTEINSL